VLIVIVQALTER